MKKGVIVNWTGRGFGFIRDEEGFDFYGHIRNFQNWTNQKQPTVGQWVEFEIAPSRVEGRNPQAVNIKVLAVAPGALAILSGGDAPKDGAE